MVAQTGGDAVAEIGASRTKVGTFNALAVAYYKDDAFTKSSLQGRRKCVARSLIVP